MKPSLLTLYAASLCLLLGACSKAADSAVGDMPSSGDADQPDFTAIVTVKQEPGGSPFFQLDPETCLFPTNYQEPFTGERRLICGLSVWPKDNRCWIHWMDFLQEGAVQAAPAGEGDGADVLEDWMTSVEDGYLTVHYETYWGDGSVPHTLLLVTGENPEDPYQVRLVHLRNGDAAQSPADALIYFNLETLPSTGGGYLPLTLIWKTGAGQTASKSFLFRSRQ